MNQNFNLDTHDQKASLRPKLRTREAAAFLGVSASMLNKLRVDGGGPVFCKLGRVCVYDLADLQAWVDARKRKSTSEQESM